MVKLIQHIPTNVITGFLGVGKTTAILHLLKHKPATERWAVLVNEFGKIGIDGLILQQDGVSIKEIPGGCMCCAAGVSVQVGINTLLANARPDRLLIEPTGIGHPKQIIKQLSLPPFDKVLDMRACITLIDPRHLQESRYYENEYYKEQLEIADVLVANKIDQCDDTDRTAFERLLDARHPAASGSVEQGQLDPAWLDLPHQHHSAASLLQARQQLSSQDESEILALDEGETCRREENQAGEFVSCGWLFRDDLVFDKQAILTLFSAMNAERIKAALHTDQGDYIVNTNPDGVNTRLKENLAQNRIEIIMQGDPDWDKVEEALLACLI